MDRSSRQKINQEMEHLSNTVNQLDLKDIDETAHLTAAEYIFFPNARGASSRIGHVRP